MQSDQGSKTSKLIQLQEFEHLRKVRKPPQHIRHEWMLGSSLEFCAARAVICPGRSMRETVYHTTYRDKKGRLYWTKTLHREHEGLVEDLYDACNEGAWP